MIALKTEHAFFQRHVLRPVAGDLVIRYVTIRKNSLRTSVVKKRYNWMSPRESSAMLKSQLWWAAKVSFEFSHGLGLRPPAHPACHVFAADQALDSPRHSQIQLRHETGFGFGEYFDLGPDEHCSHHPPEVKMVYVDDLTYWHHLIYAQIMLWASW